MSQQRLASPYERRLAIREDIGFYNAATVGAVYEFDDENFDIKSSRSFASAVKHCIEVHPQMTMVMKEKDSEKPTWEAVSNVKLDDHIFILQDPVAENSSEVARIEKYLPLIVDRRFPDSTPPWNVVVLPLPSKNATSKPRCFIAMVCSHAIGDGGSGFVFHRTFLASLSRQPSKDQVDIECLVNTGSPGRPLPGPFDTPERLPVSPEFMRSVASSSVVDAGTWTGSPVFLKEDEGLHTQIKMLEIDGSLVQVVLRASRANNAKLTATLHQLVVRALSKVVTDRSITNFASQTAIDLRGASGAGLEWGVFVSGIATSHPRTDVSQPFSDDMWKAASIMSERLAEASSRLNDQVIGMLRFIPSQKDSMVSKLGSKRDGSYALSNILAFDGSAEGGSCRIVGMVMASSAAVPSAPLSFCLVSVKDGNLLCTINWQPGALGCGEDKEASFVDELCSSLKEDLESLSSGL